MLISLKEKLVDDIRGEIGDKYFDNIKITTSNYAFEKNPFLYNLPHSKSSNLKSYSNIVRAVGLKNSNNILPYIILKNETENKGEIYIDKNILGDDADILIEEYNSRLNKFDKEAGMEIYKEQNLAYINSYEKDTLGILKKLLSISNNGIDGQEYLNNQFLKNLSNNEEIDEMKKITLKNVFTKSHVLMIYGAAGTGKTKLIDMISSLMDGRSKLFMAKTHTATENLEKTITNPGTKSIFINIDQFKRNKDIKNYDMVFIDECSTIDNKTMNEVLSKIDSESLVVLAGDIYQIESIDFGNWFLYAKSLVNEYSQVELNNTWRTKDKNLQNLWDEVRFKKDLIIEKLAIDGPYSENITKNIFEAHTTESIVLCLNYDGRFGLNNINNYFQDANQLSEYYVWDEWKFKYGDPILFNETCRFPCLYNNLKGTIIKIEKNEGSISFTINIPKVISYFDLKSLEFDNYEFLDDESTNVKFTIYENEGGSTEEERETSKMRSIIPFQIAYAVSIHKSQGLEFENVKIIIPNKNAEEINHGVFYTAITRAKKNLKIYWSAETMKLVVGNILGENKLKSSLSIIKSKLLDN